MTGANFLLTVDKTKIMVDCGLIQGQKFAEDKNCDAFLYQPAEIDFLLVTHAHADHIGRIPKLVAEGFAGKIISTTPTRELANIMLRDAYDVMSFEAKKFDLPTCYDLPDVDAAMELWQGVGYHEEQKLNDVTAVFTDAGHILGSAMITLERGGKKITFTGDVGNVPQPLMNPPEVPEGYDYLIMESVYGDRLHEEVEERTELLKGYIEDTQRKQGTLIIPAFSLERTQGLLLEINNLVESGEIEPIPTFLDSPLAIEVTSTYRRYADYLKDSVQKQIKAGDDIFDFPQLSFTRTVQSSRDIGREQGAKIIIAGSGMSHGGRILQHEKNYLSDSNTTLLLVGYQSVGSMGRRLQDGAKRVTIDDTEVRVKAQIAQIRGYSGHADRDQLLELVEKGGEKAKQVFVAMGEERASLFLVQRLRDYLGLNAVAPSLGEEVEIDF